LSSIASALSRRNLGDVPASSLRASETPSPDMSVMLETSLGELVIDLEVDKCPKTCENFLKLCRVKYYALNAFFNGEQRFFTGFEPAE
jgi:hypothetical protein